MVIGIKGCCVVHRTGRAHLPSGFWLPIEAKHSSLGILDERLLGISPENQFYQNAFGFFPKTRVDQDDIN